MIPLAPLRWLANPTWPKGFLNKGLLGVEAIIWLVIPLLGGGCPRHRNSLWRVSWCPLISAPYYGGQVLPLAALPQPLLSWPIVLHPAGDLEDGDAAIGPYSKGCKEGPGCSSIPSSQVMILTPTGKGNSTIVMPSSPETGCSYNTPRISQEDPTLVLREVIGNANTFGARIPFSHCITILERWVVYCSCMLPHCWCGSGLLYYSQ